MNGASKRIGVAIAASLLVIGTTERSRAGMITSLSSSGPGGTMSLLAVNPLNNNSVQYTANFTSLAPITIIVGVDSPGFYSFGPTINADEIGIITNSTGSLWTAFDFGLIGAPSGSQIYGAGKGGSDPFSISFISLNVHYIGQPGLAPGASFQPGVEYVIGGGTGPQTFSIQLTPQGPAVPEPTSAVLLTLGLAGVATLAWRRAGCRRPA